MVVEIAEGYSALKAAFDIAKGLKDVHDQVKINAAVIDLQQKILEAQEAVSSARDRVSALEKELEKHTDWAAKSARYQLRDFGNQSYAYELREELANNDPIHLVCPKCFGEHRVSILQYDDTYHGRKRFTCMSCGKDVMLGCYESRPAQADTYRSPF